jgi:hypothetical protein
MCSGVGFRRSPAEAPNGSWHPTGRASSTLPRRCRRSCSRHSWDGWQPRTLGTSSTMSSRWCLRRVASKGARSTLPELWIVCGAGAVAPLRGRARRGACGRAERLSAGAPAILARSGADSRTSGASRRDCQHLVAPMGRAPSPSSTSCSALACGAPCAWGGCASPRTGTPPLASWSMPWRSCARRCRGAGTTERESLGGRLILQRVLVRCCTDDVSAPAPQPDAAPVPAL